MMIFNKKIKHLMSNLIEFKHNEDYGNGYYVQILKIKDLSLLQVYVSWNDYPSWPYLHMTIGLNGLMSFLFEVGKFGIDIDIFSHTWDDV
jgi:hypothetical protein